MPAQSQQLRHGSAGSQPPPPSTPGACSSRVPIQTTGGAHVSVSQPEALYGATRRCAWAAPAPQDSGGSQPPLAIQHPRRLASASPCKCDCYGVVPYSLGLVNLNVLVGVSQYLNYWLCGSVQANGFMNLVGFSGPGITNEVFNIIFLQNTQRNSPILCSVDVLAG
jgi:hypothetical protein